MPVAYTPPVTITVSYLSNESILNPSTEKQSNPVDSEIHSAYFLDDPYFDL